MSEGQPCVFEVFEGAWLKFQAFVLDVGKQLLTPQDHKVLVDAMNKSSTVALSAICAAFEQKWRVHGDPVHNPWRVAVATRDLAFFVNLVAPYMASIQNLNIPPEFVERGWKFADFFVLITDDIKK